MGKSTISMVIFNSYVKLPEGKSWSSSFRAKGKSCQGQVHQICHEWLWSFSRLGATWVPTKNVQYCHWTGLRGKMQENVILCAIKVYFSVELLYEIIALTLPFGSRCVGLLPVTRASSLQVCNPRHQNIVSGAERHAERLPTHCLFFAPETISKGWR